MTTTMHTHTRTGSSGVFPTIDPTPMAPVIAQIPVSPSYSNNNNNMDIYDTARRHPSNATTSTSSTGGNGSGPARSPSTVSLTIRRSSSSRSNSPALGYVALMRRQKATVWCERSQREDPRLIAQQKAAKLRATKEVVGASNSRNSTGSGSMLSGTVRKWHHGAPKAEKYTPANLAGGGVPMRLSASEVGDDGDDDFLGDGLPLAHRRTPSGRSSLGSQRRFPSGYQRPPGSGRFSQSSTPDQSETPTLDIPEVVETEADNGKDGSSTGSRENSFGGIGELTSPKKTGHVKSDSKSADELRRRGSVDDRTMTMSGVRLFIANPDSD